MEASVTVFGRTSPLCAWGTHAAIKARLSRGVNAPERSGQPRRTWLQELGEEAVH